MKYFALYPGPDGLTVMFLGEFEDFDGASDAADGKDKERHHLQATMWIANEDDLRSLSKGIRIMSENFNFAL